MSTKKPAAAPSDDVLAGLRVTAAALKKRAEVLAKKKRLKPEQLAEQIRIAKVLGPLLGQLRRFDEAAAKAGNNYTKPGVIAWLRKAPAPVRDEVFAECIDDNEDDNRTPRSVLAS